MALGPPVISISCEVRRPFGGSVIATITGNLTPRISGERIGGSLAEFREGLVIRDKGINELPLLRIGDAEDGADFRAVAAVHPGRKDTQRAARGGLIFRNACRRRRRGIGQGARREAHGQQNQRNRFGGHELSGESVHQRGPADRR